MNSDFEMAEMHQKKKKLMAAENTSSSYFPVNSGHNNNLLHQPNPFPFFQEHHFIPPFFDPVHREHGNDTNNLLLPLSFKLGSSAASGGGRGGGDDAPVHRNCDDGGDVCWDNREDSALKHRFWKPLSTEFPNGNHEKECPKETDEEERRKELEMSHHQYNQETEQKTKFTFFDGELEAIYRQADIAETAQTASGSALTAENIPSTRRDSQMPTENAAEPGARAKRERKKKKSKNDDDNEYRSMGEFFESLVKRVMDHQEELHSKFLETIERMEHERVEREEAWRKQEAMNLERESEARSNQRALASSREAAILSYLEQITGQEITLPPN